LVHLGLEVELDPRAGRMPALKTKKFLRCVSISLLVSLVASLRAFTRERTVTVKAHKQALKSVDSTSDQYDWGMRQEHRSPKKNCHRFSAALPSFLAIPLFPVKFASTGVAVYAAVLHILENNDRTSTLLAFAMIWVTTATFALASAYLVLRVAETRKRLFARVPSAPASKLTRTRARY
jgi:hypothetical protein